MVYIHYLHLYSRRVERLGLDSLDMVCCRALYLLVCLAGAIVASLAAIARHLFRLTRRMATPLPGRQKRAGRSHTSLARAQVSMRGDFKDQFGVSAPLALFSDPVVTLAHLDAALSALLASSGDAKE